MPVLARILLRVYRVSCRTGMAVLPRGHPSRQSRKQTSGHPASYHFATSIETIAASVFVDARRNPMRGPSNQSCKFGCARERCLRRICTQRTTATKSYMYCLGVQRVEIWPRRFLPRARARAGALARQLSGRIRCRAKWTRRHVVRDN